MDRETYHHGSLRITLLEQARALLDEGGPTAVTLREAARRAGVSATATYRHFRDKEALLAAVAAEGFRLFAERLAASQLSARSCSELSRAYVAFALERPGLFRLMFSSLMQAPEAHPELAAASAKAFAILRSEPTKPSEETPSPEAQPACHFSAWALAHGLSNLMLDGVFPAEQRRDLVNSILGPPAT